MIYLRNLFVSFDQLLNTIFGGDPDLTISARIGFFASQIQYYPPRGRCYKCYWKVNEKIANWAWKPLDGPDHCLSAYLSDYYEDYRSKNWWIFLIPMSIIIIIISIIVGVLLRFLGLFFDF